MPTAGVPTGLVFVGAQAVEGASVWDSFVASPATNKIVRSLVRYPMSVTSSWFSGVLMSADGKHTWVVSESSVAAVRVSDGAWVANASSSAIKRPCGLTGTDPLTAYVFSNRSLYYAQLDEDGGIVNLSVAIADGGERFIAEPGQVKQQFVFSGQTYSKGWCSTV